MRTRVAAVVAMGLLAASPVAGEGQGPVVNPVWVKVLGGALRDDGRGIAVGPQDDIVITGKLRTDGDLGGGMLKTQARGSGAYLARYKSDGTHRWSQVFGGARTMGFGVAMDGQGAVALTGMNGGHIQFGSQKLPKPTNLDAFVAVFEPDGTHRWSRNFGGGGDDVGVTVAFDANGDVIVAGTHNGAVSAGGAKFPDTDSIDTFVAKYAGSDGKHIWSQALSGPGADGMCKGGHYLSLAVMKTGDIVLAGAFEESLTVGSTVLQSKDGADGFVVRLGADGKVAWATSFGGPVDDVPHGVTVDASGAVCVCGGFAQTASFGRAGVLTSAARNDVFVLKLSPDGKSAWARRFGAGSPGTANLAHLQFPTKAEHGVGIAVDAKGRVVVSGVLASDSDLGTGAIAADGRLDAFLMLLKSDGLPIRSARLGGPGRDRVRGMALLSNGDVVLTGSMDQTWQGPGGKPIPSAGREDIFLVRATP